MHAVGPVTGHVVRAREQAFPAIDLLCRDARGAGDRVRGICVAVEEFDGTFRTLHEGVVDLVARRDGAHRHRAIREALGHRDHVRLHAEERGAKRRAEPAESRDDFVEDQQDAVPGADAAQALEVTLWRDQHARGARDGLDDHGRDVAGIVQRDDAFEFIRQVGAVLGHAARVGVPRQVVRVRQVIDAGQHRSEPLAVVDHAADGDAAEADAVVTPLTADETSA